MSGELGARRLLLRGASGGEAWDCARDGVPINQEDQAATLLAIAHRIKTIIDSDQILVLDNGELVEDGPPADLIANDGAFAAMVRASRSTSSSNLAGLAP